MQLFCCCHCVFAPAGTDNCLEVPSSAVVYYKNLCLVLQSLSHEANFEGTDMEIHWL